MNMNKREARPTYLTSGKKGSEERMRERSFRGRNYSHECVRIKITSKRKSEKGRDEHDRDGR